MTTLVSIHDGTEIKLSEFEVNVLTKLENYDHPMTTIYGLCKRLGVPQHTSTQKFYVKVYRTCEKLVDKKLVWVMRGIRDPSVYLAKCTVKGHTQFGEWELPF